MKLIRKAMVLGLAAGATLVAASVSAAPDNTYNQGYFGYDRYGVPRYYEPRRDSRYYDPRYDRRAYGPPRAETPRRYENAPLYESQTNIAPYYSERALREWGPGHPDYPKTVVPDPEFDPAYSPG